MINYTKKLDRPTGNGIRRSKE